MTLALYYILTLLQTVTPQSGTPFLLSNGVTVTIFPLPTIPIQPDPSSPYAPNDFYTNIEITQNSVYTLASNRIIQVLSKQNLALVQQTYDNYSYSNGGTLNLIYLSLDPTDSEAVLSSFASNILNHLLYTANQNGLQSFQSTYGGQSSLMSPSKVFTVGPLTFAYFRAFFGNDSISITNTMTNASQTITLPFLSCSIAVTPDRQTALIWDSYTKVYVYSLEWNLPQIHIFNDSLSATQYSTETISFSSDSSFAIIETDNTNPIKVLNLHDFTVRNSIPGSVDIRSTAFLDHQNRFILIETLAGNQIYDSTDTSLESVGDMFPSEVLLGDSEDGLIYSIGTDIVYCYGINITDNIGVISSYPQIPLNAPEATNQSIPAGTNQSIPTPSSKDEGIEQKFYFHLNYSGLQNQTLSWISDRLIALNTIVQTVFSIIFSSPLSAYFLSLLNYFTLSSLFVLTDIRLPWIIFYYLSIFYRTCSGNIISELNLVPPIPSLTPELVTEVRPLYFDVSSDLVSANMTSFMVIVVNVLAFEVAVWLTSRGPKCLEKMSLTLRVLRLDIYWGLVVSNVIPIILPWKYIIGGGVSRYSSKINLAVTYLLFPLLFFLLVVNLVRELRARRGKKNGLRESLREWWESYQNFVYPMCVLVSPTVFLVAIGLSNLFSLQNAFHVQRFKVLHVLKRIYPILFESCFVVFMLTEDNTMLTMATFLCLSVFLLGSIHYLLETIVVISYFLYSFFKKHCPCSNKIRDEKERQIVRRSKLKPVKIGRRKAVRKERIERKGLEIKDILKSIQESFNISAKSKGSKQKQIPLQHQGGEVLQRDKDRKIRISKDRRQGSELVMINSKPKDSPLR